MTFGSFRRGIEILAKYIPEDSYGEMCATHDKFLCGRFDLPLTDEDKMEMCRLGWFEDEESWACFT